MPGANMQRIYLFSIGNRIINDYTMPTCSREQIIRP